MKPFRERNPVVVGAIGLAVLAGLVFAAFNAEDLPLIGGGTTYRAAFRDASGLEAGNEVRVAGVKVGKVTSIGLAQGTGGAYVRVGFRVDEGGLHLGTDTQATIQIKTVLGQKYLSLAPAGTTRLKAGAQIPLNHTASPFDVVQAVNGLAGTLQQIDTDQLAQAFTALSQTFADTPADVQTSLSGLSRLTQSISSRDDQLRTLVQDGNLLLQEVSQRRDAIHDLLVTTNELATQISGLVADNRSQLAPALTQLRQVLATLQADSGKLSDTLKNMAPFINAFTNVLGNGRWFDSWLNGLLQPYTPSLGGK